MRPKAGSRSFAFETCFPESGECPYWAGTLVRETNRFDNAKRTHRDKAKRTHAGKRIVRTENG
ncbi:protein of unknown function [Candidatus Methylomirabilis oxygeniifera]|uniref:Uncharacterized protein n=1 Tax=Methylomirabilis oxygeniifera TaxID=671143 RepID=D5MH69_METO1|nr:protein of unknown function [Candidatus Methylomirabilis oxyfera]